MKKITIILILLIGVENLFSQEPPEYIDYVFRDSLGNTIYPDLTIIENNVIYDFKKDSLFIESDTLRVEFKEKNANFGYHIINKKNDIISRTSTITYNHYLGEEIIFIAKYDHKTMKIKFFGQGMNNFGVWESGYELSDPAIIDFKEGSFLYYSSGFTKNQTLIQKRQLIEWKNNYDFFDPNKSKIEKTTLDLINNCGVSNRKELISLDSLLKNNEDKIYLGYIFKNNIPIGYGIVKGDDSKIIYFRKKIIKHIK